MGPEGPPTRAGLPP
ncbi:hypothetical protein [Lysobacter enzymogenes]